MYDFYDELTKIADTSYSTQYCKDDNHVWVTYGTDSDGEIPEETLCSCGKVKAVYEKCSLCGSRKLVAEEANKDCEERDVL